MQLTNAPLPLYICMWWEVIQTHDNVTLKKFLKPEIYLCCSFSSYSLQCITEVQQIVMSYFFLTALINSWLLLIMLIVYTLLTLENSVFIESFARLVFFLPDPGLGFHKY